MGMHRTAMMAIALTAAAGLYMAVDLARPEPERKTKRNPSGHTPHQGKREMERRRKRMEKANG